MAMIGYCGECGSYVVLTAEGMCPKGHSRSALRGVREGSLATEVPVVAQPHHARRSDPNDGNGLLAQVIGKGVVIVPIALVVSVGVWSGYEQFSGTGMSFWTKMVLSVGMLLLTFGGTYVWFGLHKRH